MDFVIQTWGESQGITGNAVAQEVVLRAVPRINGQRRMTGQGTATETVTEGSGRVAGTDADHGQETGSNGGAPGVETGGDLGVETDGGPGAEAGERGRAQTAPARAGRPMRNLKATRKIIPTRRKTRKRRIKLKIKTLTRANLRRR